MDLLFTMCDSSCAEELVKEMLAYLVVRVLHTHTHTDAAVTGVHVWLTVLSLHPAHACCTSMTRAGLCRLLYTQRVVYACTALLNECSKTLDGLIVCVRVCVRV